MKKITFLLVLFCFSCSKNTHYDSQTINRLLNNYSFETPASLILIKPHVFIEGNNGIIYQTNVLSLKILYDDSYHNKYKSLQDFVLDAFNQNLKISNIIDIQDSFRLESSIIDFYKRDKLQGLIDLYCRKGTTKEEYILQKDSLQYTEVKTLYYLFFINKYFVFEDDHSGRVRFLHVSKCIR